VMQALGSNPVAASRTQLPGGFVNAVYRPNQLVSSHQSPVDTFSLVETSDGAGGNEVDLDRFNAWLPELLQAHGEKLYRFKGFLAVRGERRKQVCQGVHMTFTGERGEPWGTGEPRTTTLVFIGKKPLPKVDIKRDFLRCLTESKEARK